MRQTLEHTRYFYTTPSEVDELVTGTRYTLECATLAFDEINLGHPTMVNN